MRLGLTGTPLDQDNPAHLDALKRAYERFPEIGGRASPLRLGIPRPLPLPQQGPHPAYTRREVKSRGGGCTLLAADCSTSVSHGASWRPKPRGASVRRKA
ncbi:DUF5953 family protein [Archangium gephyra]|uniref:DUF5953 family protein n=1 Tax=Archangium gephyra TaxID=48 RepID=UPI00094B270C|nr:DUF5953 family protein [Archangium gephyra]